MSWLRFFKKDAGDEPASIAPARAAPVVRETASPRPKAEPGTGYGENPYDSYTWELQTEPDGERQLKRAHLIDSRPKQDGETFNPYDTGKFSGGW